MKMYEMKIAQLICTSDPAPDYWGCVPGQQDDKHQLA